MRAGAAGAERPVILDNVGVMRAVPGMTAGLGPGFFASDGMGRLASPAAAAVTGTALAIDGGMAGWRLR